MIENAESWASRVRRQLRIVGILHAAGQAGIAPVSTLQLHTIAYLADALAPVWNLPILDAQVLKRRAGPMSPTLQHDVDVLVARGVVTAARARHVKDDAGAWRLDAMYGLHDEFARPVMSQASVFREQAKQLAFVQEVVNAVSGLGPDSITRASSSDAAYSDTLVDFDGLLDIGASYDGTNLSSRVALRFGELSAPDWQMTSAEMVHLYVRELYSRLVSAG